MIAMDCTAVGEMSEGMSGKPPRIVNHDIRPCVGEWLPLSRVYSGRALCLTRPGDVIQITPELRPLWPFIRGHYRRIGLDVTTNVTWDLSLRRFADFPSFEASVFYFGDEAHAQRPDKARLSVVKATNSKNSFIDLAARLGTPVPLTWSFSGFGELGASELDGVPFPCVLKPAISISGYGIRSCRNPQSVHRIIKQFPIDIPFQLQEEVPADRFLNLQYRIIDGRLTRQAVTEQIMSKFEHAGNRYPVADTPWSTCDPIAAWMHGNGMKGEFAFDVAVQDRNGSPRYWILECNPRFNGATYPSIIADRLGIRQWCYRNVAIRGYRRWLEAVQELEYDPCRKTGAIVVNWGGMKLNRPSLLLAGPAATQEDLLARFGKLKETKA